MPASDPASPGAAAFDAFPLIDAMLERRSRRFAAGNTLNGGPLAFASRTSPRPLSLEEEARLVFAAAGFTAPPLGDLPYEAGSIPDGGGGNIMVSLTGRTSPSADGCHTVILFVLNDDGAFMIRRPQDVAPEEREKIVRLGQEHRFVEAYERLRVRVADTRPQLERQVPFTPPFNKWSANVPGSTYFVPVSELTTLALTLAFAILGEEFGMFPVDERNGFKPAGIGKFAKSRGGHLFDDPNDLRMGTVAQFETYVCELASVEQGLMLENLALAAEALGLGGFPHYGAHLWGWTEALGFRMKHWKLSRAFHVGQPKRTLMNLARKNPRVPLPVGLGRQGERLIAPYCPPYYPDMPAAVRAFVEAKFDPGRGAFRDTNQPTQFKDPGRVLNGIPAYSETNIAAVSAFCDYIFKRYGQFLGYWGPLRNVMAFSAHHIDPDFYREFYAESALSERHLHHDERWHANGAGGPGA